MPTAKNTLLEVTNEHGTPVAITAESCERSPAPERI